MYGLERVTSNQHRENTAVVVSHGIRQTRDDILDPFALELNSLANNMDVWVFGYPHTKKLQDNGKFLADEIASRLDLYERIHLVGYSMGGLVSRLAVLENYDPRFKTVVTIATPNRGALGNAQVSFHGYLLLTGVKTLSPLAPRLAGVTDLTKANEIMFEKRMELVANGKKAPHFQNPVETVRYASVPALFYHENRAPTQLGPSTSLSGLYAVFGLFRLMKMKLDNLSKPHDGIVTELSCDLTSAQSAGISEVDFASLGPTGEPAICHAFLDNHLQQDHTSIVSSNDGAEATAEIVKLLVETENWHSLNSPAVKARFGLSIRF